MQGRGQGGVGGCLASLVGLAVFGGFVLWMNVKNNADNQQRAEQARRAEAELQAKRDRARAEATELAAGFTAREPFAADGAREKAARVRAIRSEFYDVSEDAEKAVSDWERRAVGAMTKELDAAPAGDPAAFTTHAKERRAVADIDEQLRASLATAEGMWADRTAEAVVKPSAKLAQTDPPAARKRYAECAKTLAGLPGVVTGPPHLAARKRLCDAALDAARWQMQPYLTADQYDRADAEAKAVAAEWKDEIAATGLAAEWTKFTAGFEYLAKLAKLASQE